MRTVGNKKKLGTAIKLKLLIMCTIISVIILSLIGCSNARKENNSEKYISFTDTINTQKCEAVQTVERDTIDILIEERKKQTFTNTIFAGLKFGCSEKEYDRIISKYKKEFNNSIYISKNDSLIKVINIGHIKPQFYEDKLYELNVYIDDDYAFKYLFNLLENKYGITKQNYWGEYIWEYTTVQIYMKNKSRQLYSRTNNSSVLYYGGYDSVSYSLTKDPSFIHIRYSDLNILKQIEKDKILEDSLQMIRELQINQEKIRKAEKQKGLI